MFSASSNNIFVEHTHYEAKQREGIFETIVVTLCLSPGLMDLVSMQIKL